MSELGTLLYIKLFGKFVKKIDYNYKDFKKTVYIFSDNDSGRAGHTSPFGTILLNENLFKKYSSNVRNIVFLHEVGHTKMNIFFIILFYILAIPILLFLLVSGLVLILIPFVIIIIIFKFGFHLIYVLVPIIYSVLLCILSSALFLIISWIDEGYAELFALRVAGVKNYFSAINEIKSKRKKFSILSRYFEFLQYPSPKIVVWLYQRLKLKNIL